MKCHWGWLLGAFAVGWVAHIYIGPKVSFGP